MRAVEEERISHTGFVLDTFALLALLEDEKGADDVAALLMPGPEPLLNDLRKPW